MKKIAIIQFPGLNSEYETKRAVDDAGMQGVIFRWNDDPMKLPAFDGYIIPGGFSYEDRGRAGLIASLDPVMDMIREEVAKGKPLLGICNGAQILVETCLIPGSGKLDLCLANNKRVKNGEVVGTGFINIDVNLRISALPSRCAFTLGFKEEDYKNGKIYFAPIAHGEGRFTSVNLGVPSELEKNDQIVFKYCDAHGVVEDDYPNNPNGALKNAAAICNIAGNIMAIMPHPERAFTAPIPEIFTSMRIYLENYFDKGKAMVPATVRHARSDYSISTLPLYSAPAHSFELGVSLIITDNTAETFTNTLNQMGFEVDVRRYLHFTVEHNHAADPRRLALDLIESGELLNTHKEIADVRIGNDIMRYHPNSQSLEPVEVRIHPAIYRFYTKDHEDFFGRSKTDKILHHLSMPGFKSVTQGILWEVAVTDSTIPESCEDEINEILKTNIFANPNSQILFKYEMKSISHSAQ